MQLTEYKKETADHLHEALAESQRLQSLIGVQKYVFELETRNALAHKLGTLLIQGVASPKAFFALPRKLILTWYAHMQTTPPRALGGKSFSKVIAAWEQGSMGAVDTLLDRVCVSPAMRANAYTALARRIMEHDAATAADMARRAYQTNPRPYRLKWLAFREYAAGDAVKAAAMLDMLPQGTPMSATETPLAALIHAEATLGHYGISQRNQVKKHTKKPSAQKKTGKAKSRTSVWDTIKQWLFKKRLQVRAKLRFYIPQKGLYSYTIVSPCYNVAPYLDDFFNSLAEQTLSFKKSIHCIMVDDGSTDETAQVIKKWKNKYPESITYIYKENGGISSARNLGLHHVNTPWVTFSDPDDFFDKDYFYVIDEFIEKHEEKLCIICANIHKYDEKTKTIQQHPLRHKFPKKYNIHKVSHLNTNIQLQAASTIFAMESIRSQHLVFPKKCKPGFEDAHFILSYLLDKQNSNASFLKNAIYFYRKREDGSSLQDGKWNNPYTYDNQLKYGYIDILNRYKEKNINSSYLFSTILYDLHWYLKIIVNKQEQVDFLTHDQRMLFFELVQKIYSMIDEKHIFFFDKIATPRYYQFGIMNCFKNAPVNSVKQHVYIETYDDKKDEVEVKYFTGEVGTEAFLLGKRDCIPTFLKTVCDDFLGRTFVLTRRLWLPLAGHGNAEPLTVNINGKPATIIFQKKRHDGLPIGALRALTPKQITADASPYANSWLFMDRDTQADDNAEHLYRYVRKYHPEINAWFVLRDTSHDWQRLAAEGFQLISSGTSGHDDALGVCAKVISSHFDHYLHHYSNGKRHNKPYIFLQHGITKDDMSHVFNSKEFSLIVTATHPEQVSIAGENTRYKFGKKAVRSLGFPRHDALLADDVPCQRQILVMPTWRRHLDGRIIRGHERELNPDFASSHYLSMWASFLCSERLQGIAKKYNYTITFFPHSQVQPYINDFHLPEHIHTVLHADSGIQALFKSSALIVTDFSSVAFEMAYLQRPVIYYQFDELEFYSGGATGQWKKGYFDYREHGFGPVVTEEGALLDALENLLARDAAPDKMYLERMETTFAYRDQNNCARVFEAICDLDKPNPEGYVSTNILRDYTRMAVEHKVVDVAMARAERLCALDNSEEPLELLHTARAMHADILQQKADALFAQAEQLQHKAQATRAQRGLCLPEQHAHTPQEDVQSMALNDTVDATDDASAPHVPDSLSPADTEEFYKITAENLRLQSMIDEQNSVFEMEKSNAFVPQLGTLLIQGVASPKELLALPCKLWQTWRVLAHTTPPPALGGKSFSRVITEYEQGGMNAADTLIKAVSLSPSLRANAYTVLARHIMLHDAVQAADAARQAYEADPQPYRRKWLAFREYDAGNTIKASAMLDVLPQGMPLSATETAMAARIHTGALFYHQCQARLAPVHTGGGSSAHSIGVEAYDHCKDAVEISYTTDSVGYEAFYIGEKECIPTHVKTVCNCDSTCAPAPLYTRRVWLPMAGHDNAALLSVIIDDQHVPIKTYSALPLGAIRAVFAPTPIDATESPYANCWLFIDRDTQADDNAEHLYRYVAKHYPNINAVFALRDTSHDWQRLSEEGFNLVSWGSAQYDEALRVCAKFISSQTNTDVFRTRDGNIFNKQYTFLQHGVIKDDQSREFNKKNIDLFITATQDEWASIASDTSCYKFGTKTVRCEGLPRHDALLAADVPCQRQILIMPTWRKHLVGKLITGSVREINTDFVSSHYLRVWSSLLCAERLKTLANKYKYNIVFFPHFGVQNYIHEFHLPKHIHTVLHADTGIQTLFKSSALMITDFSSVAFEMAYLQRPVIYYQFDEQDFYSGSTLHHEKGYYDYREHGFGPVLTEETPLLDALENLLARDAAPEDVYLQRMNTTFAYRDRNNCARVFKAISDLDNPYPKDYANMDILRAYTRMAIEKNVTAVALARAELLYSLDSSNDSFHLLQEAKALCVKDA